MRAKMVSRDNARRDVGVLGGGEADARSQRQRYAAELQQQVDAKKVRYRTPSPWLLRAFPFHIMKQGGPGSYLVCLLVGGLVGGSMYCVRDVASAPPLSFASSLLRCCHVSWLNHRKLSCGPSSCRGTMHDGRWESLVARGWWTRGASTPWPWSSKWQPRRCAAPVQVTHVDLLPGVFE
jgi:hypothetical protein